MKTLTTASTFQFNGITLTTGDHIAFKTDKIPLPHVEAAFTHVREDGRMDVFSTLLVPFQHNGLFAPEDVQDLMIIRHGKDAVSLEARNPNLGYGGQVQTTIKGRGKFTGELLAAFDGIVAMWCDEIKDFISGGSTNFYPI